MTYQQQLKEWKKRNLKIIAMRKKGMTYEDIAIALEKAGYIRVRRQRICQICKGLDK